MMNSQIDALLQRVRKVTAQTAENLQKELRNIEQEKRRIVADLDDASQRLTETLRHLNAQGARHNLTGRPMFAPTAAPAPVAKKTRKGKRIRRGPEQLKEYADGIYQLVKTKGAQGARGGEIRAEFPKVGQDIKGFMQKHGGYRLKTTGEKSLMRYHAS